MSKNQLPVTDLANIATLPISERRARLEAKRSFVPPHSLEHTRRNFGSLLGIADPLFPDLERKPKEKVLKEFERSLPKGGGRAEKDRRANLLRAKALLNFRDDHVDLAAREDHRAFLLAEKTYVRTADPVNLMIDGRKCIPSSDLRKSGALTERGLKFYFSMNYHMIVDYDPDFADFDLVHLDYWQDKSGDVGIKTCFHSGPPEYSYDELNLMIRETLDIWQQVVEARRAKSGSEDDGFWFGQTA